MTGQSIAHYEVLDKLGEGGMGVVYRARDTKLNREVAVKVLPQAFAGDEQRMGAFEGDTRLPGEVRLKQLAKLLRCQSSPADDDGHCVRVDGIVARYGHDAPSIRHCDVFPLAHNPESGFAEGANGPKVRHSRNRHLVLQHHLAVLTGSSQFLGDGEVFPDGIPNIVQRFLLGFPLRGAAGKARNPNAVAFVGFEQRNVVTDFAHDQSLAGRTPRAHRASVTSGGCA